MMAKSQCLNLKVTKSNKVMKNSVIGLVGASGFGSEVMPLLEAQTLKSSTINSQLVFIDSDQSKTNLLGHEIVTEESFLQLESKDKFFNISVADPEVRKAIQKRILAHNIKPISIFSEDIRCLASVEFGEGAIVCPHALFTSNIQIGSFFHCNYKSAIAHDCTVGDFVTLAPGVFINGNVTIEDEVYIGAGAVIKQGVTVGKNSVIGMGAVVLKDVIEGTTVVGNPAKEMKRNK